MGWIMPEFSRVVILSSVVGGGRRRSFSLASMKSHTS